MLLSPASLQGSLHCPANHQARVCIQHHCQIDEFLGQADVSDIGHPKLIPRRRYEIPRQVWIDREAMFGIRGGMELVPAKTQQIIFTQDAAHAFVVCLPALAFQLSGYARPSISRETQAIRWIASRNSVLLTAAVASVSKR